MNRSLVERVSDDWLCAEFSQRRRPGGRAGQPGYAMASANQTGNETAPERAGRSGDEYAHGVAFGLLTLRRHVVSTLIESRVAGRQACAPSRREYDAAGLDEIGGGRCRF
jgi:hypothetical protein